MSFERGTRPGGPRTDAPADNRMRLAGAAVLVVAALLVTIAFTVGALMSGAAPETSPAPSVTFSPRPTVTPDPSPTPTPTPGDPDDLPRYPASRLTEHRQERSGPLVKLELEYTTSAGLDRVRRHYRSMLRHHGWFVGEVGFDDDGWEIEANKGTREASIELQHEGDLTEVEVEISWPAAEPARDGG